MQKYEIIIGARAIPTPRPRVTSRGITYYPKRYSDYLRRMRLEIKKHNIPKIGMDKMVTLYAHFVFKRAKGSKIQIPVGDIDNLSKGLMDSMDVIFDNDRCVCSLIASKSFAYNDAIIILMEVKPCNGDDAL